MQIKFSLSQIFCSRSYPATSKVLDRAIIKRSNPESTDYSDQSFIWTRKEHSWMWLKPSNVRAEHLYLKTEVSRFVIAIQSQDFEPEKYEALCEVIAVCLCVSMRGCIRFFLRCWRLASANTVSVLEAYLSVFATGQFQGPHGEISFDASNFDVASAQESSSVRDGTSPTARSPRGV
jgi:hypothetical protein